MKAFWITYAVCSLGIAALSTVLLDSGGAGAVSFAVLIMTASLTGNWGQSLWLSKRVKQPTPTARKLPSVVMRLLPPLLGLALCVLGGMLVDVEFGAGVFVTLLLIYLGRFIFHAAKKYRASVAFGLAAAVSCLLYVYLWSWLASLITGKW